MTCTLTVNVEKDEWSSTVMRHALLGSSSPQERRQSRWQIGNHVLPLLQPASVKTNATGGDHSK